jgi:hypothetical protein
MTAKNRIMIFGPKDDGTYVVEFRTAAGEALAISIPRNETAVIRHFQERMPYGLFVPQWWASRVGSLKRVQPFCNGPAGILASVGSIRVRHATHSPMR